MQIVVKNIAIMNHQVVSTALKGEFYSSLFYLFFHLFIFSRFNEYLEEKSAFLYITTIQYIRSPSSVKVNGLENRL